jgi:hypothetical protein
VALDDLVVLASEPLGRGPVMARWPGALGVELQDLLSRVNGFYAFESALHVRGAGAVPGELSLDQWNAANGWRTLYGPVADGHLFFAEDAFGGQFSISTSGVATFDPETGEAAPFATDLDEWADRLLDDHSVLTGYPLAHDWQAVNGPIPPGSRLVPTVPFVLGGAFSVDNLYALDAAESMRLRAELASQIRDLPDGASVSLGIVE